MAYGSEAMIPANVKVPSFRYENFDEETNTSLLAVEKDMIEERREDARIRMEVQKQRMAIPSLDKYFRTPRSLELEHLGIHGKNRTKSPRC